MSNIIFINSKESNRATETMKSVAEKRLASLEKYLKEDEPIKVTIKTYEKNDAVKIKVQVVTKDNYHARVEDMGYDYYDVLTKVCDVLKLQITKRKEKNTRRQKTRNFRKALDEIMPEIEMEEPIIISKVKNFKLEAITEQMALKSMQDLGHNFYVFKNNNRDNKVCAIYERMEGDYALIEFAE